MDTKSQGCGMDGKYNGETVTVGGHLPGEMELFYNVSRRMKVLFPSAPLPVLCFATANQLAMLCV